MRIVALIDMDCFYAQVEQRERPELWDKPVVVVQYAREGAPGGILAVSYEARPFGVKRGMMAPEAIEKCPSLNICYVPQGEHIDKADIQKYRDASAEVFEVLHNLDKRIIVERASVDEAFLDMSKYSEEVLKEKEEQASVDAITNELISRISDSFPTSHIGNGKDCNHESIAEFTYEREAVLRDWLDAECRSNREKLQLAIACSAVEKIRADIREKTQFYCSAGIGPNKILAKLVCARHKPRQQTVICSEWVPYIFKHTKITDVRMLGGKTGNHLKEIYQIETMEQLACIPLNQLSIQFPSQASWLHGLCQGNDDEPVKRRGSQLSIAVSKNFPGKNALTTVEDVKRWIEGLCKELSKRLVTDQIKNKRTAQNIVVGLVSLNNFTKTLKVGNYDSSVIFGIVWNAAKCANKAPKSSSLWEPPILNIHLSASRFSPGVCSNTRTIMNWVHDAVTNKHSECTSLSFSRVDVVENSDSLDTRDTCDTVSESSHSSDYVMEDNSSSLSTSGDCEETTNSLSLTEDGWQIYNPLNFENIMSHPCSSTMDSQANDLIDYAGTKISKAVFDELPDFIRSELNHEKMLVDSRMENTFKHDNACKKATKANGRKRNSEKCKIEGPPSKRIDSFFKKENR